MYTAILVDAYAEVHSKLVFEAETSEIQMSIGDVLNKWYIMILRKLKMHIRAENCEREMKSSKAKAHYEYLRNLLHRYKFSSLLQRKLKLRVVKKLSDFLSISYTPPNAFEFY